jgi:hypothetical protein
VVDGGEDGRVFEIAGKTTAEIDGFTIQHGHAKIGAGIKVDFGAILTLLHSVVQHQRLHAVDYQPELGGGIYVDAATLNVDDCQILRNEAFYEGGGIYTDRGSIVVTNSTLNGNFAALYHGYTYATAGGAFASYLASTSFVRCTMDDNHADSDTAGLGGSFYSLGGKADLEDCTITNSSARQGGGVFAAATEFSISRSDVSHNSSETGGGLCLLGGPNVVVDCRIARDSVAQNGGGLYVQGHTELVRCMVIENNALLDGGGVDCAATGETLIVVDSVIGGNTADHGGGLDAIDGTTTLVNSTVAGNSCGKNGGGIRRVQPAVVHVDHSIIARNHATSSDDVDGEIDSLGYICVGTTAGSTIVGDPTGNLLDVNPRFADPTKGDCSLKSKSPCIDAGNPVLTPGGTDVAGNPRLLDGDFDRTLIVDMGAYEFDHVHLAVSGSATPGGTLLFTTTGQAGLSLLMFIGLEQSEFLVAHYGSLFIDLSQPWLSLAIGSIPDTSRVDIDPTLPVPLTVHLQELALDVAARAGNFGNLVTLNFE